jgi:type I restriction enzyme S subunit
VSITDIPDSWSTTKFTDVLDVQGGTQPPKSQFIAEPKDGYIRLLQIRDFGDKPVPTYIPDTTKLKKCSSEDVLIGRYGASLGRICTGMTGAYNVALAKVLLPANTISRFIRYYLLSDLFQLPLRLLSRSAQNGFNKDDLATFDFVLPPLAEQKQIAAKLDELLAQVDSIKTRLDAIPAILKCFRQSVLAAAVSGRLTEEWREENNAPACVTTTIGEVARFQNGFAFKSSWFEGGGEYQVVKLANVKDGYLKLEAAPAFLSAIKSTDYLKFSPNEGDLLISMTGTRHKKDYGYVCEVSKNDRVLVNQRVGRIIPKSDVVNGKFLLISLRSEVFREQFFMGETGGVNQGNVGSGHIKSCDLNLPSLDEQAEIVRRLEELFTFANQVEQRVKDAQSRVNHLTQSILAKAFRGELTAEWREQNPDLISGENSAQALLERIKAEQAKLKPKKKARKKSAA